MKQQLICTTCGYTGSSVSVTKGNILMELILWLFFIIPGLIYSIWRLSSRVRACPKCKSTNMIPVDSPVGQKLVADQKK